MTRAIVVISLATSLLAATYGKDAAAQSYTLPPFPPDPPDSSPVVPPPRLMSPFPVVRIVGQLSTPGARIRFLGVKAPVRARIEVRCSVRGCRKRLLRQGRGINRSVRFRAFEVSLKAGTIIEIRVRREGTIGKFTRFRVRRGRPPARRDLCLRPGSSRGSACPDS